LLVKPNSNLSVAVLPIRYYGYRKREQLQGREDDSDEIASTSSDDSSDNVVSLATDASTSTYSQAEESTSAAMKQRSADPSTVRAYQILVGANLFCEGELSDLKLNENFLEPSIIPFVRPRRDSEDHCEESADDTYAYIDAVVTSSSPSESDEETDDDEMGEELRNVRSCLQSTYQEFEEPEPLPEVVT